MHERSATGVLYLAVGAGMLFVGYSIFSYLKGIQDNTPADQAGQKNDLLSGLTGNASIDPSTGLGNGVFDSVDNSIFSEHYPGGGETSGTSETYSGAGATVIGSPIDSIKSLLGWN